jgi:hypothetical protein
MTKLEAQEYPTKIIELNGEGYTVTFYDPTSEMDEYHIDGQFRMVAVGPSIGIKGIMKMNGIAFELDEKYGMRNGQFQRMFQRSYSHRLGSGFYGHGELTKKIETYLSTDLTLIMQRVLDGETTNLFVAAHNVRLYNDWVRATWEVDKARQKLDELEKAAEKAHNESLYAELTTNTTATKEKV